MSAGYNRIRLQITPQGGTPINVTDFAQWQSAVFIFEESEDQLSYVVEIRDIILLRPAADIFINPASLKFDAYLEIITFDPNVPNIDFRGIVTLDDVQFVEDDLCKITIRLDSLDLLVAQVSSKLINPHRKTLVLREPQRDASFMGFVATALVLAFSLIYTTYQVYLNITIGTSLTGTGVGGVVTGPVFIAVSIALLSLYIILFVVALVRVIQEMNTWIRNTRIMSNAYNIRQSVIDACTQAGYSVDLQSIQPLSTTWLVTPPNTAAGGQSNIGNEIITAKEIFEIAKVTLNARVWVYNNIVSLVPVRPVSTFPPSHPYKRSFVRRRSYDTSETANIFIVGLTRDPAEGYSFLSIAAVMERITQYARGTRRIQLPYSPHRVKLFETFLDRAIELIKLIATIATAGIAGLVILILQALNVISYDKRYGHIIVEGEGWNAKLLDCDDIEKPGGVSEERWLRKTAQRYPTRVFNKYETTIPLTTLEFYNLYTNGFPNTISLKWQIISEYAEVVFVEENTNIQLNYTERFI